MKWAFVFSCLLALSCNDQKPLPGREAQVERPLDSPVVRRASANPYATIDLSPIDISYFPVDYPKLRMSRAITQPPVARVIYSRPHKQGRRIFGDLLAWGAPWRLGANEATEIQFFQAVTVQGKRIAAGRYTLYAVPEQNSWTLVFNSNLDSWGLQPDPAKDLFRFTIPVRTIPQAVEHFTMVFEKTAGGADLVMAWDIVEARLPIRL